MYSDKFEWGFDKDDKLWLSQCSWCRRYDDDAKCEAFPAGVPSAILENKVGHFKPIKGDGGLVFDPKPGVDATAIERRLQATIASGDNA